MDVLVRNAAVPEGRIVRFNVARLATPGGQQHVVVVFHDVTADRRQRDELMSFAGVVAHDLLNPLTTIEGWAEVLESELAGYKPAERVSRIQRAAARMRTFLNGLLAYTAARDGKMMPTTINLQLLQPGLLTAAQHSGLAALARHVVTQLELRRYARDVHALNQRLQNAERIKDEFIARVNHEFRTPLTSIHGYLEMLGDPELPSESRDGFLRRVQRNSDRLLALVDDILLAAQVSADSREFDRVPADLAVLARTSAAANRPLAEAKGLTITAETTSSVFADIDLRRMGQALERLILNAIKFTPSGTITVTADVRDGHARLLVRDTGIGISQEDQERVLAPFCRSAHAERAEVQGLGLGLSIVKAIAEGHDGTVTIHSGNGNGTTVGIEVPASGPYPEL